MASERRSESLAGIFFGGHACSGRPPDTLQAAPDASERWFRHPLAWRAELTRERRTKHTYLNRWYRFPATLRGSSDIVGARIVSLMQNWK